MENGPRTIGLRAAAGFLAAITIIVAVFAAGIQLPSTKIETGRLTVLLKDDPVELEELWINVTDLGVHRVGGEDGGWITLDFSGEADFLYFDLLEYQNDKVLGLASVEIATGTYNKIRMTIENAKAIKTNDEIIDPLKVPPGHIDVITKFDITSGENVVVLIDMEPDWVAISKNNSLRPVLKASISQQPSTPQGGE
jgi:hypothetical protein